MTLRELLKKTRYKAIFNKLYAFYFAGTNEAEVYEQDLLYRRAFEALLLLPFNSHPPYKVYIGKDGDEVEVSLLDVKNEKLYACDLTPWEYLIDAPLEVGSRDFAHSEIAAYILWEITFYGFTPNAIHQVFTDLRKITP